MPNSYFKFQQFTVHQAKTAMKVGIDGVLLGAWINQGRSKTILDIGTGTGLLALMLAQKSNASITAIEIEKDAFNQAVENFKNSKWPEKIQAVHSSLQDFANIFHEKFDLIICNPPFFSTSLKSQKVNRNIARHDDFLSLKDLFSEVKGLLNKEGHFYMIYPFEKKNILIETAAQSDLFPIEILFVKPTIKKNINRILLHFSFHKGETSKTSLIIKNHLSEYSEEFKKLTKDFYLTF